MHTGRLASSLSLLLLCLTLVAATGEPGTSQKVFGYFQYVDSHTFGEGFDRFDTYTVRSYASDASLANFDGRL